eukprot:275147-Hanusia_phi.AAC.1
MLLLLHLSCPPWSHTFQRDERSFEANWLLALSGCIGPTTLREWFEHSPGYNFRAQTFGVKAVGRKLGGARTDVLTWSHVKLLWRAVG